MKKYYFTREVDGYGRVYGTVVSNNPIRNWHSFHTVVEANSKKEAISKFKKLYRMAGELSTIKSPKKK